MERMEDIIDNTQGSKLQTDVDNVSALNMQGIKYEQEGSVL